MYDFAGGLVESQAGTARADTIRPYAVIGKVPKATKCWFLALFRSFRKTQEENPPVFSPEGFSLQYQGICQGVYTRYISMI